MEKIFASFPYFLIDTLIHRSEKDTKSKSSELDKITKSNTELAEAIDLATKILFP